MADVSDKAKARAFDVLTNRLYQMRNISMNQEGIIQLLDKVDNYQRLLGGNSLDKMTKAERAYKVGSALEEIYSNF